MEGLEISVKQFSELSNIVDDTLRFDAEHYQRKYEQIDEAITEKNHCVLRELLAMPVITGHTPSMKIERFYGGEISFIKTDNLRENKIVDVFTDYLTVEGNEEIKNSALEADDVIVTIIGATFDVVGRSAIVRKSHLPANINQNIALIRLDKTKINPTYLNAYLNTKYGRGSLHHHSRQTEQVNLNCREVERVLVPLFNQLEAGIESLSTKADTASEKAALVYSQAETLLLDTLGMADFLPSSEAINIKSFKDSFSVTGRLDAEYYQPKYEQMVSHITGQPHARLIKLVDINKSIEPGSDAYSDDDEGLPFLRVADYSKYGITKPQKCLSTTFVAENSDDLAALMPKKNTILFSKDGSVGEAYCLREDANFITSGAVLHLTVLDPDNVLPEYLTLALNSKLVKMQAERDAGGSIILHWRVGEIENVVVPLVDMPTQEKIAAMVQESFTLKAESERLLDVAKRAVEIAIEQDENAALSYLEQQNKVTQ